MDGGWIGASCLHFLHSALYRKEFVLLAWPQARPCPVHMHFSHLPSWPLLGSSYRGLGFQCVQPKSIADFPFLVLTKLFSLPVPSPSLKAQRPQSIPLPLCPSALQFINCTLLSLPGLHGQQVRLFLRELSNYLTCLRTASIVGSKSSETKLGRSEHSCYCQLNVSQIGGVCVLVWSLSGVLDCLQS